MPRVLAPLAFFAATTALILIVHRSLTAETTATPPATTSATTTGKTEAGTKTNAGGKVKKRYYRVRPNDLLATIAERFDTTVEDLIQLNPGLDPNNLQVGQRVRVR